MIRPSEVQTSDHFYCFVGRQLNNLCFDHRFLSTASDSSWERCRVAHVVHWPRADRLGVARTSRAVV